MSRSRKPDYNKNNNNSCTSNLDSPISPLINLRSSSSSSSGEPPFPKRSDNNNSGELSVSSENNSPTNALDSSSIRSAPSTPPFSCKFSPRRSTSGGEDISFCGGGGVDNGGSGSGSGSGSRSGGGRSKGRDSTPPSPLKVNVLPAGNIVPSGKILNSGFTTNTSPLKHVLATGERNYGHGSVVPGTGGSGKTSTSAGGGAGVGTEMEMVNRAMLSTNLEFVKNTGNDQYRKGRFKVALGLYDRAIAIAMGNAVCRCNRAAALMSLGRLGEAVRDCEDAVALDPSYWRAHQRLGSLYLRLGQVENARVQICFPGQQSDPGELQKLQQVEKHLTSCSQARSIGNWETARREGDAAIVTGADSCPQLYACRAEASLKLHRFVDADSSLSRIPKFEPYPPSCSKTEFFGMRSEAYVFYVQAQVEVALGRFDNAVTAAEKAGKLDPSNIEVGKLRINVPLVKRARDRGNELFSTGNYTDAASSYGEGLKLDPSSSVLYYNRSACWFKLGLWKNSVHDCNCALEIQPSYTKALLRRAESYGKLGHWAESVRDYEILRKESPGDKELAEALNHALVALKKSLGKEVQNLNFGGEIEEVSDLDRFRAAISSSGTLVVYYKAAANQECKQLSLILDTLHIQYSSVKFLKVDVKQSLGIAKFANVIVVPAVKIYKNGRIVEEMNRPSQQMLELSFKTHLSL